MKHAFSSARKTEFAQTNLKLTWVQQLKLASCNRPQVAGVRVMSVLVSFFPGLPVCFIVLFVLCLHLLLVSFFCHGRLKSWKEKCELDLFATVILFTKLKPSQNMMASQNLDEYKAMRKTSTIYKRLNQSTKQVTGVNMINQ